MAWTRGQILQKGKYNIRQELGRGRFGVTYRARDQSGHNLVIKTINEDSLGWFSQAERDRLEEKFSQEAVKLARCQHSCIIQIKEIFKEGARSCIAMEYIAGTDLASRSQKVLPEKEALNYIQQIGEALIKVHSQGLLHRDVKPQNIMIRAGKPEAVLIDFGLALDFDHDLTVTRTKEIADGYAPIELYSRSAKRGAYTDVYALAATLYNLLTGEIPVSAKDRKLANPPARLISPKELNPQISEQVNKTILKGMELAPEQRPQSMHVWLNALGLKPRNSTRSGGSLALSSSNWEQKIKVWTVAVAAIAALGTLLSGLAGWIPLFKPASSPSPSPSPSLLSPTPHKTP